MTATTTATAALRPAAATMNRFERWLTLWVALCIVTGIVLGQLAPGPVQAIGRLEIARVNIPVGVVALIPVLIKRWRGRA